MKVYKLLGLLDEDLQMDSISDFEDGYNKAMKSFAKKHKVWTLDSEIEDDSLMFFLRKVKEPHVGIWGDAETRINFDFEKYVTVKFGFGKLTLSSDNTETPEQTRMFKNIENGLNRAFKSYSIDPEIEPDEFEDAGKKFASVINKEVGKYLK